MTITARAYAVTRQIYNQALFDHRLSLYELGAAIGMAATAMMKERNVMTRKNRSQIKKMTDSPVLLVGIGLLVGSLLTTGGFLILTDGSEAPPAVEVNDHEEEHDTHEVVLMPEAQSNINLTLARAGRRWRSSRCSPSWGMRSTFLARAGNG